MKSSGAFFCALFFFFLSSFFGWGRISLFSSTWSKNGIWGGDYRDKLLHWRFGIFGAFRVDFRVFLERKGGLYWRFARDFAAKALVFGYKKKEITMQ